MYWVQLFIFLACVVSFSSFDQSPSTYVVNEGDGTVLVVVALTNPSSTNINIEVSTTDGSATGEY